MKPLHRALRALAQLACTVALATGLSANAGAAELERAATPDPEVLTLDEAAALLRVDPTTLGTDAEAGRVPGRQIGREWRFSRTALLAWLAGAPSDPSVEATLSGDLAALSGRGPAGEGPSPVGEPPQGETAEEVSLREQQVLLRPGQLVVEPSLSYSFDQTRNTRLVVVGTSVNIPTQEQDERSAISSLTARYGLLSDTELFGEYTYERDWIEDRAFDFTDTDELKSFSGGVRQTLFHERPGIPSLVLLLGGRAPVTNTSPAFNAGIAAISSSDPAVLFGGFQYQHVYARDFDKISLLEHRDTLSANLGYAFALNEALTLSLNLSGVFGLRTTFDHPLPDTVLEREEEYFLRFAMTRMLSPGRYIEPVLTFVLNGNESKVILGLNVPFLTGRGDH